MLQKWEILELPSPKDISCVITSKISKALNIKSSLNTAWKKKTSHQNTSTWVKHNKVHIFWGFWKNQEPSLCEKTDPLCFLGDKMDIISFSVNTLTKWWPNQSNKLCNLNQMQKPLQGHFKEMLNICCLQQRTTIRGGHQFHSVHQELYPLPQI